MGLRCVRGRWGWFRLGVGSLVDARPASEFDASACDVCAPRCKIVDDRYCFGFVFSTTPLVGSISDRAIDGAPAQSRRAESRPIGPTPSRMAGSRRHGEVQSTHRAAGRLPDDVRSTILGAASRGGLVRAHRTGPAPRCRRERAGGIHNVCVKGRPRSIPQLAHNRGSLTRVLGGDLTMTKPRPHRCQARTQGAGNERLGANR